MKTVVMNTTPKDVICPNELPNLTDAWVVANFGAGRVALLKAMISAEPKYNWVFLNKSSYELGGDSREEAIEVAYNRLNAKEVLVIYDKEEFINFLKNNMTGEQVL